jgi:NADPH:quinone reductase-like Zn-dependent oxidoreductase
MQFETFGDPSVLHPVAVEVPTPGAGDVLIRNVAVGVNPFDWKFVAGLTSGGGTARPFPLTPGNEGAGVIEAVGSSVEGFAVGDEVIWRGFLGGYATHRAVVATSVWPKPANLLFTEAAGLAVAGGVAYSAMVQLDISGSDTVLIHAAAGGLGTAAVQLAVGRGATVIATASAPNHEYLESLGAIPVSYGDGLAERVRALATITAAIDFIGSREAVAVTRELLGDAPRAVTTVHVAGIPEVTRAPNETAAVIELAAEQKLVVEVSREFPLVDAAAALDLSRAGHVRGKIVLLT